MEKSVGIDLPQSPYYKERTHRRYDDKFTILWTFTRTCNYRCAYDDLSLTKDCSPFKVDDFVGKLKELNRPFRLVITGGEPLLKPWMVGLCQKVGAIGGEIEMQTNFSVNAREFIDGTSPSYVSIIETSYHPDERRRFKGVKEFIENFKYAKEKGFNITVWHIDYPRLSPTQYLNDCKELYDAGITPIRKRYQGTMGDTHYLGDSVHMAGRRCNAGYNAIAIWEDFSVTPCEADRGVMGNFLMDYKLFPMPITCPIQQSACMCRELVIDKYEDPYYKRTFGE